MDKTKEKQSKEVFYIKNTDQLLNLMSIYLEEFNQRNIMQWKQIFVYYFAILIVMILPFAEFVKVDFGDAFPKWLFPLIGLILSLVFFVVSIGYAIRLKLASEKYNYLIKKLDKDFQRESIRGKYHVCTDTIFGCNMTTLICIVMFFSLLIIGGVLIIISV